jgi:hypothetical protein
MVLRDSFKIYSGRYCAIFDWDIELIIPVAIVPVETGWGKS